MKKILISVVIVLSLLLACFTVGCTPAKLEKITGTYRLTKKTTQHISDEEPTDLIAQNQIIEYIVLTGTEKGYYIYSDKTTALSCKEVKIEYNYSSNDPEEISSVKVYTQPNDYVLLYVNYKNAAECFLVYEKNGIKSELFPSLEYSKKTHFTRISDDVTLATVNRETGQNLGTVPFPLAGIQGLNELSADYVDGYEFPYAYRLYDLDIANRRANIVYAYKSDMIRRTETAEISYDLSQNTFTVGEEIYSLDSSDVPTRNIVDEASGNVKLFLFKINGYDINSYADSIEENYLSSQE